MRYMVKVYNGDYSPSFPYDGKSENIAISVATAYIAQGKRVSIIEIKEKENETNS